MKYKKLLLVSLFATYSVSSYATPADYKPGTQYSQGQEVNDDGKCYVCKIPGWCSSPAAWAYEPGKGTAWQEAWTEGCDDPGPSPQPEQKKTISVNVTGDNLPSDVKIEFSNNGQVYTVNNNQVTLPYFDDKAIDYKVSVSGADSGSISPESFTMTKDTTYVNLTYKASPAPVPGKCDPIPENVEDFIPNGQAGHWSGYSKGAFVKFNGSIYELINSWWTSASPADDSAWVLCEAEVQAQVNIGITGLPEDIDNIGIKIGDETYEVNPNNPQTITLSKGSYNVSADSVLSPHASKNYVAKSITPNPIVVNEETKNINLNIEYQAEDVKPAKVNFNVNYAQGTYPTNTTATITNSRDYKVNISITAGSNTISIPSKGEFTISPNNYKYGDKNYKANSITVVDGKVQGTNTISYKVASSWPEKVIGGYTATWGVSGYKIKSINTMSDNGYNVVLLAFGKVFGTNVGMFDDATICKSGCTWDYDYTKENSPLVIMSFGGIAYQGTWQPDLSSDQSINEIAKGVVSFAAKNHLDGVDFDLESLSAGISGNDVVVVDGVQTYPKITKLITAIREEANKQADKFPRGFYITAAPQTYGQDLYWAATGTKSFDSMLKSDACGGHECFDAIFVQNYNSSKMNPNTAYDITSSILKKGNNNKTKIEMGYDLASGEWSGNYPVIGWESETSGPNAPIVSAKKFAQEHPNIGAFVWQAEQDAFGGASNRGEMNTGKDSYSFAHAMKEAYK